MKKYLITVAVLISVNAYSQKRSVLRADSISLNSIKEFQPCEVEINENANGLIASIKVTFTDKKKGMKDYKIESRYQNHPNCMDFVAYDTKDNTPYYIGYCHVGRRKVNLLFGRNGTEQYNKCVVIHDLKEFK